VLASTPPSLTTHAPDAVSQPSRFIPLKIRLQPVQP
jgi:hypothetical protein